MYQIYPRSFQDSDGDGIGDLRGVESRLDHLVDLGVDAFWLSPIYPSPLADFGYDISDYTGIDPVYGTFDDFDRLVASAHERGLRVLMDLVPSHTSIEHPWFREHPDRYIWADGNAVPNNWPATFGGPAWSRHPQSGRWYLHSFYPEQPDLNWRNPDVAAAIGEVIRFWLGRGVDGFRVDAIDRIMKDAGLRDEEPAMQEFGLPLRDEERAFALQRSRNAPDVGEALAQIRSAAGEALLVGEVYLPASRCKPYLEHFDACFAFEFFHAPWEAPALRRAIEGALALDRPAWVLSNHDFPRLATRFGARNVVAAATLLLTLPGLSFVYQGDEIGMADGPGGAAVFDRAGRDPHRHPMQWEPEQLAGFTSGSPWLPVVDAPERSVAAQRDDPDSLLALYRRLIALRREMGPELRFLDSDPHVLEYERGPYVVAVDTASGEATIRPRQSG